MKHIGETIKQRREELGLSQEQLAERLGYKSRSSINKIELGKTDITQSKIVEFANALNTTPAYLMELDTSETTSSLNSKKGFNIPVLGTCPCGIPIEAIEDIIDYEEISHEMAKKGEYFGLIAEGDSMSPRILDGDVIIVRKTSIVDSGKVAIVKVNGNEATCKKVLIDRTGITLVPFNPMHNPISYTKEEVKNLPITICGQVEEVRGKL